MLWLLKLCVLLTLAISPGVTSGAEQRALLALAINGIKTTEATVLFRGDDVLVPVTDLKRAGVIDFVGKRSLIREVNYVSLKSLAHILTFDFQAATLTLQLTVKLQSVIGGSPKSLFNAAQLFELAERPSNAVRASGARPARVAIQVDGTNHGYFPIMLQGEDVLIGQSSLSDIGLAKFAVGSDLIAGEFIKLDSLSPSVTYQLDKSNLSLKIKILPRVAQSPEPSLPTVVPSESKKVIVPRDSTGETASPPSDRKSRIESKDFPPLSHSPPQPPRSAKSAKSTTPKVPDQPAILTVRINEIKKGETDIILRGDDVLVRASDLEAVGIVGISGEEEIIRNERFVLLSSLSTLLSFKINDELLSLDLTANPSAFGHRVMDFFGQRPKNIEYRDDTSAFLNYSFQVNDLKHLNAFSEAGLSIGTALAYSSVSRNAEGSIIRGFSNLTFNNRESMNRVVVGDRLIGSDALGGSVTLGGISYYKDFALDPYYVRNPGLNYSGGVATPSNLDVYVNGNFVRRIPIAPGQFDIRDLPIPAGSADTRLVLRDAFGREREITSENYFPSGLLKQGAHEFSYNMGTRRNLIGLENWDYGPFVFLARHRLGFTDYLTGGLRLEGTSDFVLSGGPSISLLLPFGETEIAAAASVDRGQIGGAGFFGYNYTGRKYNISASIRLMSLDYATTSLRAKDKHTWLETNFSAGTTLFEKLGVSLGYTFGISDVHGEFNRARVSTKFPLSKRIRIFVDANYSRQFNTTSLGFQTGINFLIGSDTNASYSMDSRDGQASHVSTLQKSLPTGPGYGYRLQSIMGASDQRFDSVLQYQTAYGRYEANYSRVGNRDVTMFNAAGGLAYVDGSLFAARPVQDSFAVLRIPDMPNIRGFLNNIEVGRTNTHGDLFIPNLLSYYGNKLSISPKDVPINYNIEIFEKTIAPPYRGGSLIEFPARRIQRLVGQVVIGLKNKEFVPAYGQLTLKLKDRTWDSPLGNNAEFYFENITAGSYQAIVNHKEHNCEFTLEIQESKEDEIKLGRIRCPER